MLGITIRPLLYSELDFLEDMLFEAIYLPPDQKKDLSRDILRNPDLLKYFENWGRVGDVALAAEDSRSLKGPIGAVWGRLFSAENQSYGFINEHTPELSIGVIEDYRNQGIGTKLIRAICTEYRKKGYKQVSLSVDGRNPCFNLYQREGFVPYDDNEGSITMLKLLM